MCETEKRLSNVKDRMCTLAVSDKGTMVFLFENEGGRTTSNPNYASLLTALKNSPFDGSWDDGLSDAWSASSLLAQDGCLVSPPITQTNAEGEIPIVKRGDDEFITAHEYEWRVDSIIHTKMKMS